MGIRFVPVPYSSGTDYYIDPVDGLDANDGLTTGSPKQTFAILCDNTGHKNFYLKADTVIYTGTTSCNIRIAGTTAVTDQAIISRYGTGANPIIDGSSVLSGFTTVDANLYSKDSAVAFVSRVLTEDGIRLAERRWNTDIATTKAGTTSACTAGQPPSTTSNDCTTDAMVAGTWTQNTSSPYTIYIWPSTGIATDHTYRYATTRDPFYGKSTAQKITFKDIDGRMFARNFIGFGIEGDFKSDIIVDGVSSSMTGERGFSLIGHRVKVFDSYCEDASSEALSDNAGCIVISGNGSNAVSTDGEIYNNTVRTMRNGSCVEINATLNAKVYNNDLQGCSQLGIEQYGSSGGAIVAGGNLVERNFISTIGSISLDPFSNCLRAGSRTNGNINRNNICFGYWNSGLFGGTGTGNQFLYNTYISLKNNASSTSSSEGGINENLTAAVNHSYIGNILYMPNGGRCVNSTNTGSTAIMDTNACYQVGHANPYRFRNTSYATLALYQAAYTSALGLTDNSIYGSIDIDLGTYEPNVGASVIGVGKVIPVFTDYDEQIRGFLLDIGAKQRDSNPTKKFQGSATFGGQATF